MIKPTSVRIMLFILYFKIIMLGMGVVSLFNSDLGEISANNLLILIALLVLGVVSMVIMVLMINRRKLMPTILISFAVLLLSMFFNLIQVMLSFILILMLVLRTTRGYFRGENVQPARVSGQASEVIDVEADEAAQAALEEPEDAPAKPSPLLRKDPEVTIREATPEDADTVYTLMMLAFEEYRTAIPPSSALEETEESILKALQEQSESAAILYEDDTASAMVRYKIIDDAIYFFRLSVVPNRRRRGYARQLVKWIEKQGISQGLNISRCRVRQSVQNNLVLYQNMGYEIVDQELIVRTEGTVKALTLEKKLGV
ncbi:GNAT family N-acetyltransferase [Cohnella cholangitidis]|uniref:GNAT family N-acetyltransferase n=1 Tax=Cohnella cholangitidis TaxID=2598458 RepID=A0A7G5C2F6_9BACL|nr:GNAT family N-acetyltransferase [Cohnella cholangitidis]QMV43390.1 GNAT family N-acetyltransferase [Cohnella cholangitidis]